MLEILKTILFGLVEGVTEWLPISSTGHLIILESFCKLNVSDNFWSFYLVAIQFGAIIAVIIMFWNEINPFGKIHLNDSQGVIEENINTNSSKNDIWKLWLKVLIACIPAAIIGFLLDDFMDSHFYNGLTVSITLIFYGIVFIFLEISHKNKTFKITNIQGISIKVSLMIGLFQILSLIPGTSRSGITIIGAMILGCDRKTSAQFSFFLSIPVMLGASLLKGIKYLVHYGFPPLNELSLLLIGMIIAFLVSILIIKYLMNYIKKHDFKPFGWYRIILGFVVLFCFLTHII